LALRQCKAVAVPWPGAAALAYAAHLVASIEERPVAKPNYAFEKRQRELEKKKKKEEKAQRKQTRGDSPGDAQNPADAGPADASPATPPAER
jgi:hypothetical protein